MWQQGAAVQPVKTAHGPCKDVAALGVHQPVLVAVGRAEFCQGNVLVRFPRRPFSCRHVGICRDDVFVVVADGAAADVDGHMSMRQSGDVVALLVLAFGYQLAVVGVAGRNQIRAHRCQSAAAVDAAQHRATQDVDAHIALHDTGRQRIAAESAACTEDVAIDVCGSPGAYDGTARRRDGLVAFACRCLAADGDAGVAFHVAVLTASEYGAIDGAARDVDLCGTDVRLLVEQRALVALASTKDVARHWVCQNICYGARHAYGTATHVDGAGAQYVGQLVASIDAGQYVAAGDVHRGVAFHTSGRLAPLSFSVWEVSAAAAEDVAVERVTVIACIVGIRVIGRIFDGRGLRLAKQPVGTLCEAGRICVFPLFISVGCRLAFTAAYLSAGDGDMRVVKYTAVLAAAVDAAGDKCCSGDVDSRIVDV